MQCTRRGELEAKSGKYEAKQWDKRAAQCSERGMMSARRGKHEAKSGEYQVELGEHGSGQGQGAGQQRQRADGVLLPLVARDVPPGASGVMTMAMERGSDSGVEIEEVREYVASMGMMPREHKEQVCKLMQGLREERYEVRGQVG